MKSGFLVFFLFPLLSSAFVTSKVPLSCGYSDFIYEQIPQWTQEKSKFNRPFDGLQSETGRRLLGYSDASWILTFEFFSDEDVAYDISCIVMQGEHEQMADAPFTLLKTLPAKRLGPELRLEDEIRIQLPPWQAL